MEGIGVFGRRTTRDPQAADAVSPENGDFYMFWLDVEHWHCTYIASGFREDRRVTPAPSNGTTRSNREKGA